MRPTLYALRDPRDRRVRYVGGSTRPRARLRQHVEAPSSRRVQEWIAELAAAAMRPILEILSGSDEYAAIARTGADLNVQRRREGRLQTPTVACSLEDLRELKEAADEAGVKVAVLIRHRLWGPMKVEGDDAERTAALDKKTGQQKGGR